MALMNYYPLPPEAREIPLDDYTGVLAFSGGVESTALMAHLKASGEKFVAFNLAISLQKPPYGPIEVWMATQRVNARKIAAAMGVHLMEVDIQMTNLNTIRDEGPDYSRGPLQRWYLRWYMSLLAIYNPGLQNLYYGFNDKDSGASPEIEAAFSVMAGGEKFKSPLSHTSKEAQWKMIPDDIKPFVLTCYNKVCGTCFKCQERIDARIPLK